MTAPGADPTMLVCPACGEDLADGEDSAGGEPAFRCSGCGRRFPIVAGIPDLRVHADGGLDREHDLARARALERRFDSTDLESLLRERAFARRRPRELTERFIAGDMATVARSEAYVAEIERDRGSPLGRGDHLLELGCGTAGISAVASRRAGEVVASDISMQNLVVAKKRLLELGADRVTLVCCAAEHPPFRPDSFEVVAASDVVEHVPDQEAFARSCRELLRPGGRLFLATPNRFSLSLEPHVRLWGVGYLPRGLARRYVRAVRKTSYEHVRLLSARGLRRLLRGAGFERVRISVPEIPEGSRRLYSGLELRLVHAYNRVRRRRPARAALIGVGPFFHVFAEKGAD